MKLIASFLLAVALITPVNASVINSWYPQVVDYVYVNNTMDRAIEYSIFTSEQMIVHKWSVDGIPAGGTVNGSTYSYTHTWNNRSVGFHRVIYTGSNANSHVEFGWYVNVYDIDGYRGGSLFDVIDETLENHITDIKIRMFKYRMEKDNEDVDFTARVVNRLRDDIADRQNIRETLHREFKAGNITIEKYASALKKVQRDTKNDIKQAKELARISKDNPKNGRFSEDFEKISEMEDEEHREHGGDKKKEKHKETEDDEKDDELDED